MEKLSERFMFYSGLLAAYKINHPNVDIDINADDLKYIQDLIDAEEQGLLLKLPCKVGSSIWYIDDINEPPMECVVTDIEIKGHYILYLAQTTRPARYFETVGFCEDKLGVDWWLTKKEAEQALAEMKGE